MAVYKRAGSKYWWYKFIWNGERIQKSAKTANKRTAEKIEAAHKTRLAKGEVGIQEKEPAPSLQDFAPRFTAAIEARCAAKPRTVAFYREKLARLLEYDPLASARLSAIDERLIEGYVIERQKRVAPATANRQLATLRRLLRLAYEWKVIDRVPRIRLLPGERNREFVLSFEKEKVYLAAIPQPLHDIAVLLLDTGLRVGEALSLQWPDVHLEPAAGARYGYVHVRDGKSKYAKRNVSLTERAAQMLRERAAANPSPWVFPGEKAGPFLGTSLNHQHQKARTLLKLPADFVIHSFRHTMLTRLGEAGADAFTIMRIAGHSSVTVSQKYVHPTPEAMERAIERMENLQKLRGVATISATAPKNAEQEIPANTLV